MSMAQKCCCICGEALPVPDGIVRVVTCSVRSLPCEPCSAKLRKLIEGMEISAEESA